MIKAFKEILAAGLILISVNSYSQVTEQWVSTYNHAGSTDIAYGIAADNSGNLYVTGNIINGTQGADYATIKYDPSGTQEWVRIYNGTLNSNDYARAITSDTQGNIYVTGFSTFSGAVTIKYNSSGDSLWVRDLLYANCNKIVSDALNNVYCAGIWGDVSFSDYFVVKYNSSGDSLWSRRYSSPGGFPDVANGIAVDNSGNVYLTGLIYVGPHSAIATLKYNSSGVLLWNAVYDNPAFGSDVGISVDYDNLGNVYVAGYGDSSVTGRDMITIKYNSSGVQQWVRRYDDGNDEAVSIKVFDANSIYVTGPSLNATRASDFILLKYDSNGMQQWLSRYDRNNGTDRPSKMILDNTGNIYITGMSQIEAWEDAATVKFNSSGTVVWSAIYNAPGIYPDIGLDLVLDNMENVCVAGRTYSASNLEDYLTIKYSQTTGIQNISSEMPENFSLHQNYPNPFNPSTTIVYDVKGSINSGKLSKVNLTVYDALGKEVTVLVNQIQSPGRYSVEFNAKDLSSGLYYCRLMSDDFAETRKMLVNK